MPMTAAEKQKKYRQRLKNEEPEKYGAIKKKTAERALQYYRKKAFNYNEEQKEERRKKWREDRKKAKEKKQAPKVHENDNSILQIRRVNYKLREENKNLRERLNKTLKGYRTLQKRLNRQEKKIEKMNESYNDVMKKINDLEHNDIAAEYTPLKRTEEFIHETMKNVETPKKELVKKKILQHDILNESLKSQFQKSSNAEKSILKKLIDNDLVKKYKQKTEMTGLLGLKNNIKQYRKTKTKTLALKKKITAFFNRDDVSRATAGKKEYRTFKKVKRQKRYLLDKLRHLHKKFISDVCKISFSTFKKYRPFYVLPPKLKDCESCACLKHSNMQFLIDALGSIGLLKHDGLNDVISSLVCDPKSKNCMYDDCEECSIKKIDCGDFDLSKKTSWFAWVLKEHIYGEGDKKKKTKRMMKIKKEGTVDDLIKTLNADMKKFKQHVYNFYHQYKQYRMCADNLKYNEALIHIDFSENFVCKHNKEIQAMHFGAAKVQITLHTGVLYLNNEKPMSFCSISPENKHSPEAIWAHLDPILKYIKNEHPNVSVIHFFSDGPTTQYRQKKNFYLFSRNLYDYGFSDATWSFFEAAHGKGAADGIGGAIKRNLDLKIAHGTDIPDAETAYNVLTTSETNIKMFYIPAENIKTLETSIAENLTPVPQTMKIHQLVTDRKLEIKYRHLSCFCDDKRGKCDCHSPQNHSFTTKNLDSNKNENKTNRKRTKKINKTDNENISKAKMRKTRKQTISSEDDTNSEDIEYADSDATPYNIMSDMSINFDSDCEDLVNVEELDEKTGVFRSIKGDQNLIQIEPNKKINVLSVTILKPKNTAIVSNERRTDNFLLNISDEAYKKNQNEERDSVIQRQSEMRENQSYESVTTLSKVKHKLENTKSSDLTQTLQILDKKNTYGPGKTEKENVPSTCRIMENSSARKQHLGNYMRDEWKEKLYADEHLETSNKVEKREENIEKFNESNTVENKNMEPQINQTYQPFAVKDSVIVRYYQRKTWKYYMGFITNLELKNDEILYKISFLKTVNKPELKFVVNKKLDVDVVPTDSIVKRVILTQFKECKDYHLSDDFDRVYFE